MINEQAAGEIEVCNPEIRISRVFNEGTVSLAFTEAMIFPKDFADEINQSRHLNDQEKELLEVVMINGDTG